MEEFKLMARLLAAIRASEDKEVFDLNFVSEQVLKTTARRRDKMAMKLKNAGYITGIVKLYGIDNLEEDIIMWDESKPEVTIKGMEYIQNSEPLRKAINEIKETGIAVASQVVANMISHM